MGALSPLGPAGLPWWDGCWKRTWCGVLQHGAVAAEVPANCFGPMTPPINHHESAR